MLTLLENMLNFEKNIQSVNVEKLFSKLLNNKTGSIISIIFTEGAFV